MVKSFTWRWLSSLWNKAKVIDCLRISGEQSAQHILRDVYSGVATLLALCAGLTCRLTLRVLFTCGLYFVPAGVTTSVSQLWVATSLRSEEVWVPHSLKNLIVDRSPFHKFICGGVVCPLFYLQIFLKTSMLHIKYKYHFFLGYT